MLPALVGSVLLTALLWWGGASMEVLQRAGAQRLFGPEGVMALQRLLAPWSYGQEQMVPLYVGGDGSGYATLHRTAMQMRFFGVFVLFGVGVLAILRWLPPTRRRLPATVLAVWMWAPAAATLAIAGSAPWELAGRPRASFRVLPQLASAMSGGAQLAIAAGLAATAAVVLTAWLATRQLTDDQQVEVEQPFEPSVKAARLAASTGTLVVAFSLFVLSYQSVAGWIQRFDPTAIGVLSEPGELLRQWLLLGGWAWPGHGSSVGDWLLARATDLLLLAVVWWSLRLLPGRLTRASVPALMLCTVCAIALGLLVARLVQVVLDLRQPQWNATYVLDSFGGGFHAALTFGVLAGATAGVTLRAASRRTA
jgi:hypothetical protein